MLVQDIDCPELYNLIPVVNNKVAIPKIQTQNNSSNKRKHHITEDKLENNNKRIKVEENITNLDIVKSENCDSIDIEETDLSTIKIEAVDENVVNHVQSNNLFDISSVHEARLRELVNIVKVFCNKDFLSTSIRNFKFNSSIFKSLLLRKITKNEMLPSMPFLLTPCKSQFQEESESPEKDNEKEKADETEISEAINSDSPEAIVNNKKVRLG